MRNLQRPVETLEPASQEPASTPAALTCYGPAEFMPCLKCRTPPYRAPFCIACQHNKAAIELLSQDGLGTGEPTQAQSEAVANKVRGNQNADSQLDAIMTLKAWREVLT